MLPPVILTTGSRAWGRPDLIEKPIIQVLSILPCVLTDAGERAARIVNGGNSNKDPRMGDEIAADALVTHWVENVGCKTMALSLGVWRADFDNLGRRAGPVRNQEMVDNERPDFCVAYLVADLPCRGTRDTMERCFKAGIPVLVISR